jgi:eukaryotic-like serine/threonine-protein kinase
MHITIGTRLGAYEITGMIGKGGMGEVYKAHDKRLNRTVAIKVLPEHSYNDPESKQRLEREAQMIAALTHPHICAFYEVSFEGVCGFVAMEYINGRSLAEILQTGALCVEEAIPIATQLAQALEHAHRHGILHLDVKPSNMLITNSGVKLVDFGLARRKPCRQLGEQHVDEDATSLVGTPEYMTPEYLQNREIGPANDVWAFACVLHEMLCTTNHFAEAPVAERIRMLLDIRRGPLPPLQFKSPGSLAAAVQYSIEQLLRKCFHQTADRRYQTFTDVIDHLKPIGELLPIPLYGTDGTASQKFKFGGFPQN